MRYLVLFLLSLLIVSCMGIENDIQFIESELDRFESKADMSQENMENLDSLFVNLDHEILTNRRKYTDEQIKKINMLKGRYAAICLKSGLNGFKKSMEDAGEQIEGFIEEIQKDSINN